MCGSGGCYWLNEVQTCTSSHPFSCYWYYICWIYLILCHFLILLYCHLFGVLFHQRLILPPYLLDMRPSSQITVSHVRIFSFTEVVILLNPLEVCLSWCPLEACHRQPLISSASALDTFNFMLDPPDSPDPVLMISLILMNSCHRA